MINPEVFAKPVNIRVTGDQLFLLRLAAILIVIAVGMGVVLFLVTGNRKALRFALWLLKWGIVVALAVFALIILERVAALT